MKKDMLITLIARLKKDPRIDKVISIHPKKNDFYIGVYVDNPDDYAGVNMDVSHDLSDITNMEYYYQLYIMSDDRMPEELRNELESDCEVIYERQRV
jgi:hypothetical protein